MLVEGFGSPLNVIFPSQVHGNISTYNEIFAKHRISGRVFFAHKANKSTSLLREVAVSEIGVDVASEKELVHALSCGVQARNIEITGPKNISFLYLAIRHGVTVAVDSFAELQQIEHIAMGMEVTVDIVIRLSNFLSVKQNLINKESRFGISTHEIPRLFRHLKNKHTIFFLKGFSFHLDTINPVEKSVAVDHMLACFEQAKEEGFDPSILCIGGGYKANYLQSEREWSAYIEAYKQSFMGKQPSMAWQDKYIGIQSEHGVVRGQVGNYAFFDPQVGPHMLDTILSAKSERYPETTISKLLQDGLIQLWIEPGKSLVDQVGITITKVMFIKHSSTGSILIGLDMKRTDVVFNEQELFVDPIVIQKKSKKLKEAIGVYFVGNLCLESDVIYKHMTYISVMPEVGDLVVFINTAGYAMDFNATESIMQRIAQKVAVWQSKSKFSWSLDSEYKPEEIRRLA